MIMLATRKVGFCLAAALSVAAFSMAKAKEPFYLAGWRQIAWPFPRDAWEPGLAFVCISEECGDSAIYIRPKIGFCNCATGVRDDEEVDRVTDLDLIDPAFKPLGDGTMVEAAGMRGRARNYLTGSRDGTLRATVGIALARRCDVVVAIAQSSSSNGFAEQTALDLLSSRPVQHWVDAALDNPR